MVSIQCVDYVVYHWVVTAWLALAGIMFVALWFVTAPYGRHRARGRGPTVPSWLGWLVMESPSVIAFVACYATGRTGLVAWILFGLWQLHYVHRAFVFPFRMRGAHQPMPLAIAASALCFTSVNGWLNAYYITAVGPGYPLRWFGDPRFLVGAALFLTGYAINQHADRVLFRLRAPGETGYKIPYGGLYRFISCPNYFGEMIEWCGWALATWSPAGLAFALWTVANLAPRAHAHHRWYRATFPDYPPERKALIPGLF
jgi:3-oxo-5-alpha-steroid 4-dehydrogenase 1